MSTLKTINIIHPSGSTNNIVNDASGNITVGNNATLTGTLTVNSTGVMNIGSGQIYKDASGNVGIGTSSPSQKLTVSTSTNSGQLSLTGAQQNAMQFLNATGGSGILLGRSFASNNANDLFIYDSVAAALRLQIDPSGNLAFNSGYGSAAVAYGCRAWVSYNGTGTPAIRGSANVSSVTRSSTGLYIANLTSAMPDTNYAMCVTGGCYFGVLGGYYGEYTTSSTTPNQRSTSAVPVFFQAGATNAGQDNPTVSIAVFR